MSNPANSSVYFVETLVMFRHRYLIVANSAADAEAKIRANGKNDVVRDEWQQKYLGEVVMSSSPITDVEMERMHQSDENKRDGNPWMPVSRFIWSLEDEA